MNPNYDINIYLQGSSFLDSTLTWVGNLRLLLALWIIVIIHIRASSLGRKISLSGFSLHPWKCWLYVDNQYRSSFRTLRDLDDYYFWIGWWFSKLAILNYLVLLYALYVWFPSHPSQIASIVPNPIEMWQKCISFKSHGRTPYHPYLYYITDIDS